MRGKDMQKDVKKEDAKDKNARGKRKRRGRKAVRDFIFCGLFILSLVVAIGYVMFKKGMLTPSTLSDVNKSVTANQGMGLQLPSGIVNDTDDKENCGMRIRGTANT